MPTADHTSPLAPSFEVSINNSVIPIKIEARVTDLTVDQEIGVPSMFTMELAGSDDMDIPTAWIDDQNLFSVGLTIEISLGYFDDLESLFIGEITGLEPEFNIEHQPTLTVRGFDHSQRLCRNRKTRTFIQLKDSDIATQIAKDAGLTPVVTDSRVIHDYVLQANKTDFEFLFERASRIRYEFLVQGEEMVFKPTSNAEGEIAVLTMNDDLLEFYPRLSVMQQVTETDVRGWNPRDKKTIVGIAKPGDEDSMMGGKSSGAGLLSSAFGVATGRLGDIPVANQAEADQIAQAYFNKSVLGLIIGEGICLGRTDLQVGKVVKIDGVGKRFSGPYYIKSLVHHYSANSGYLTRFVIQRNAI